jgi:glycosyltransferase involved in cell wall biosynthesis
MPFFSVIIPTYNRAKLVSRAVESVLKQSFQDLELLVIDDGSTDNTREALAVFASDKRFNYVYQENTKESGARNNGMRLSRGQWVCLLDSDDVFLTNHLQVLHDAIVAHKSVPGVYHALITRVYSDGRRIKQEIQERNPSNPIWGIARNELIPSSSCMHTTIAKNFSFREDLFSGEDTEFFFRVALQFPIITIEEFTTEYMMHTDNSATSYGGRHVFCANRILHWRSIKQNTQIKDCFPKGFINGKISRLYQWKGMSHAANRHLGKTIGSYLMSMYYKPILFMKPSYWKELGTLLISKKTNQSSVN